MKTGISWVLRIGIFILIAVLYAGTLAERSTMIALGEGILTAAYVYMIFYLVLIAAHPITRAIREAWNKRSESL